MIHSLVKETREELIAYFFPLPHLRNVFIVIVYYYSINFLVDSKDSEHRLFGG